MTWISTDLLLSRSVKVLTSSVAKSHFQAAGSPGRRFPFTGLFRYGQLQGATAADDEEFAFLACVSALQILRPDESGLGMTFMKRLSKNC
jgi:hypothetical protein